MVREWAADSGMILVEEQFFPVYQARLVGPEAESGKEAGQTGVVVDRLSLNPEPINLDVQSALEYTKRNPNSLFISVGEQSESVIRASVLSAMTDDTPLMTLWKRCRKQAGSKMIKGAWVENTVSGSRSWLAGHYYTAEAKRLVDSGVAAMGGTDWLRYHLGAQPLK